jgi:hypothetical protein
MNGKMLASLGICTMSLALAGNALAQPEAGGGAEGPYALRGVELGITLDQFKAIPVPADDREGETQTWCTDQTLPRHYSAIDDALSRKYGTGKIVTEPLQTRSGDTFDNSITIWRNSLISIRLEERYGERDSYLLTYRHQALSKLVDAEIEKNRAAAAEKI